MTAGPKKAVILSEAFFSESKDLHFHRALL